jgi:hypothetical protein
VVKAVADPTPANIDAAKLAGYKGWGFKADVIEAHLAATKR